MSLWATTDNAVQFFHPQNLPFLCSCFKYNTKTYRYHDNLAYTCRQPSAMFPRVYIKIIRSGKLMKLIDLFRYDSVDKRTIASRCK